ncbi:hypothetical protein EVAR_25148_1 [Eumeta japonica]|uniref:Uncharacterized protein n=1 Tax=Eumeta variegata TaxID=151549 RepID=A0A4C1VS00_EUMVA|nr:hypothetical protein EVAR_25148_1 [Eumeta japonica]
MRSRFKFSGCRRIAVNYSYKFVHGSRARVRPTAAPAYTTFVSEQRGRNESRAGGGVIGITTLQLAERGRRRTQPARAGSTAPQCSGLVYHQSDAGQGLMTTVITSSSTRFGGRRNVCSQALLNALSQA